MNVKGVIEKYLKARGATSVARRGLGGGGGAAETLVKAH